MVLYQYFKPELILNWDQTGISPVPGSSWTMEVKGSKRVEISDKCQITAIFCGAMTGKFLPPQQIYQGKTSACLPWYKFPNDWHVTYMPNHWSNEDKMKEYRMWIASTRSLRSHLNNLHWPFLMFLKASKHVQIACTHGSQIKPSRRK